MIIYDIYDPKSLTYKKIVWTNGLEELESIKFKQEVLKPWNITVKKIGLNIKKMNY